MNVIIHSTIYYIVIRLVLLLVQLDLNNSVSRLLLLLSIELINKVDIKEVRGNSSNITNIG